MKKLMILFVVFLLVLTACGKKNRNQLESFEGQNVATVSNLSPSGELATETLEDDSGQFDTEEPAATSTYKAPQTVIAPVVSQEPTQKATTTNLPTYAASQSPYPIDSDPTKTPVSSFPVPTKTQIKTSLPQVTVTKTPTLPSPRETVTKTSTSPSLVPTETPTKTSPPQVTVTRTPTSPSPTRTATPSATATFSPDSWEGEWQVSFETENGMMKSGTLVFSRDSQDASVMLGKGTINGEEYQFSGVLFNDDIQINGDWQSKGDFGVFWIYRDQFSFNGNNNDNRAFCGARPGQKLPTDCFVGNPR